MWSCVLTVDITKSSVCCKSTRHKEKLSSSAMCRYVMSSPQLHHHYVCGPLLIHPEKRQIAQISFKQTLDGVKQKDERSFSASLWATNGKCQIAIRTLCRFSCSIQFRCQSSEADHLLRTVARIFRHQMYLIYYSTNLFEVICRTFLGKTEQHWYDDPTYLS